MIYPKNFEDKIGFSRVRDLLKAKCLSDLGKDKVDRIRFVNRFDFVHTLLEQTHEMKEICETEDDFPVSHYIDVRENLSKAKVVGTYLSERELFDLKRSLETIRALVNFFKNRPEHYENLRILMRDVAGFPELIQQIDKVLDKFGKVKDNASPELLRIRRELMSKQSGISKRMSTILGRAQQDGYVDQDVSVTIRDGKMLIPVPASHKRKIKGFVYDESATGKTVFIEPVEIVELNNALKELEFAERREIIRILQAITELVRPYIPELDQSYNFMGNIDCIRAKALLAIEFNALKPILSKTPEIDWYGAVHPLLEMSLRKENKSVVPLYLKLDKVERILLISGPNAGGKSVCLKTVGLLQYMLQCGLLIPVQDNSHSGVFKQIFIDIGDEQSLENDLSTYSSHLVNMKHFTRNANESTLFLIDEFGTGTEPLLGGAIAEAILERLNNRNAFGLVTTHYTNLKHFATAAAGIVNGAMQYDTQNMKPLFILKVGKPGSSFAFEIARNIGLANDILQNATDKIGKEHIDFDKNLKAVDRERQRLENKQRRLQRKQRELDELIIKHSAERDEAVREKKRAIKEAKQAADKMASTINKRIENTISEIRKAEAEKERTKHLREELVEFAQNQIQEKNEEEARIERKMQKLRNKAERAKRNQGLTAEKTHAEEPTDKEIKVGDYVQLEGQAGVSEVLEIAGKNVTITLGQLKTTVKIDRLKKLSRNETRKQERANQGSSSNQNWPFEKNLSFKVSIDLRGKRGDEALGILQDYIDEAIVGEAKQVRILHGKGNGILRQLIRQYLNTVDFVDRAYDEQIDRGGDGITVVDFVY